MSMIFYKMKMNKKGGNFIMNGSDRIVSMLYIKRDIPASTTDSFCSEKLLFKEIEIIKERIAEFRVFK